MNIKWREQGKDTTLLLIDDEICGHISGREDGDYSIFLWLDTDEICFKGYFADIDKAKKALLSCWPTPTHTMEQIRTAIEAVLVGKDIDKILERLKDV